VSGSGTMTVTFQSPDGDSDSSDNVMIRPGRMVVFRFSPLTGIRIPQTTPKLTIFAGGKMYSFQSPDGDSDSSDPLFRSPIRHPTRCPFQSPDGDSDSSDTDERGHRHKVSTRVSVP